MTATKTYRALSMIEQVELQQEVERLRAHLDLLLNQKPILKQRLAEIEKAEPVKQIPQNYAISAKLITWEPTANEQQWDDRRYGFSITYDPGEADDYKYYASWGEGPEDSFATLEEAQQWCQNLADALVRDWLRLEKQELESIPKGWKLAPIDPIEEMQMAAINVGKWEPVFGKRNFIRADFCEEYKAALAAAPQPKE